MTDTDAGGAARPLRVLVVDDDPDARGPLLLLLRAWGHEPAAAADGRAALVAAAALAPDVVLLDLGLPDADGCAVARRLRRQEGPARALVVALSGHGRAEDVARALRAGCDLHLSKPCDPDALRRLLASCRGHAGPAPSAERRRVPAAGPAPLVQTAGERLAAAQDGLRGWVRADAALAAEACARARATRRAVAAARERRRAARAALPLVGVLLLAVAPAADVRPSAEAEYVPELALLTWGQARSAEGRRGLSKVELDTRPGDSDRFLAFDCKGPQGDQRTVWLSLDQTPADTMVVEATMELV